jgi:hypothetical protein
LSGQILSDGGFNEYIDDAGNLTYWKNSQTYAPLSPSSTLTAYGRTLSEISSDGFPTWNNTYKMASVTTNNTPQSTNEPYGYGGWGMSTFPKASANGYFVTYNTGIAPSDIAFHLGGLKIGNFDWSWKTSRGGMLRSPDDIGTFPEINSYGGHNGIAALVEGGSVIQGYDGQYGSFSSQWMHWTDDGLLVGQFGHPANGKAPNESLFLGAAGNIAAMASATVGASIYLYTSDESYHPGIHRWRIGGLGTIHELSSVTSLGKTAVLISQ